MKDETNYFEVNKDTWNKKVLVHAQSEMYDLQGFKSGKSSLMPYELNAMGDVSNKSILHLQCHFGLDTLSWSRMGAQTLGIDISDEAIKLAKQLNEELGLGAKFVCCNVLDTSKYVSQTFDIVFTSYGVLGWLPHLKPWATMIAERLKPGGFLYLVEFHPILWMFDYTDGQPKMRYHYSQDEVIYEEYQGTYSDSRPDKPSDIISKEYGWNHGLSEVINALIDSGLQIDYLNEYDESPYNVFPDLIQTNTGMYHMKDQLFPMIFELKATKTRA